MVCPDDGPAVFWKVVNAEGQTKNADYGYNLHIDLRKEVVESLPGAQFVGYVMDSTATNRKAMQMLQDDDPAICVIPCASHALSLVIKHAAKYFSWINDVYSACCAFSEKLINAEKLRSELHGIQLSEYSKKKGICAHVPTRFGSRHMVLRDVESKDAIKKLSATDIWKQTMLKGSAELKKAHDMMFALEDDLFSLADKLKELLVPVVDAIHTLEADQPTLSYLGGLYDNLEEHFKVFSDANPHLATGEKPIDKRRKDAEVEPINLLQQFDQDRKFMWWPVMSAAAVLDPLNWCVLDPQNGVGKYHVPVQKYSETMQSELTAVVSAFES